jgi:hypothetical protein
MEAQHHSILQAQADWVAATEHLAQVEEASAAHISLL